MEPQLQRPALTREFLFAEIEAVKNAWEAAKVKRLSDEEWDKEDNWCIAGTPEAKARVLSFHDNKRFAEIAAFYTEQQQTAEALRNIVDSGDLEGAGNILSEMRERLSYAIQIMGRPTTFRRYRHI